MFKRRSQKSIYRDAWLELFQDEIEFPDGSVGTYAWVNRKNGVGVVVVTPNKKILLHREYRYVINDYSWEVQGGGIDAGETPEQAAVREIREEAGIVISEGQLQKLGIIYPLHSFNTESVTLFMVLIEETVATSEGSEVGEVVEKPQFFSFEEVLAMVDSGKINDAVTSHLVQMAVRKATT
jgi:mutator protein MutT